MALIEKGKEVLIVRGADSGKKAKVLDIKKEKGKGVMLKIAIGNKERFINIRHVEPIATKK